MPITTPQGRLGPIVGAGESAERVRNYPWDSSPLGPIDRWPSTLVAVVNLALNTSVAAAVYWGPELIFIGNDASARMAGPTFKDSIGLTAPQLWGAHWPRVRDRFKAVLTGGHSFCDESLPCKFNQTTERDEVFLDYSLSPIFHEGAIAGVYRTLVEVTDEVQALRSLAETGERLRMALAAGNSIGFWDWHIQDGLVYADKNTAQLYGIDPKAAAAGVSHLLFERMLHPDDIPVLTDAIMDCLLTGNDYTVDYRVRQPDGSYRWLRSTGRPIYDQQGHATRVTGLKYDITDLRLARPQPLPTTSPYSVPVEQWKKVPRKIQALLEGTIYAIASKPEEITLEVVPGIEGAQLILHVASVDVGKVLGKEGKTIKSIRTLLRAVNGGGQLRYSLDVEASR